MEGKGKFLHGTLEVTIFRATMKKFAPFKCIGATERPAYVTIKIDNKKFAKTSFERDRVWNQTFQILCAHPPDTTITVTLKTKHTVLGSFGIIGHDLLGESSLINGKFPICKHNKKSKGTNLHMMLWFKPAGCEKIWENALVNGEYHGPKNASFPKRSNCSVILYQDTHHCPDFVPPLGNLSQSPPRKLWEDIYNAIDNAKHFIYIAGWSFNPEIALVRDPQTDMSHARGVKLGELLKRKANEGVAVRILVWDDETSLPIIKNKGVMKTHDQDALSYFKHSKVICKLCPRLHDKFPTVFAHHQKTITVDTFGNQESIMSFLGGLDLCGGRYDTEQHSLFHTLNEESHFHDFYQTSLPGATLHKGGPRQPWHDTHACVIGEAAWDVLANFEQRWKRQCSASLLPIREQSKDSTRNHEGQNWDVQVFRSIDHSSATLSIKHLKVERSIHEAYVDAIRRADMFIFIENQYFIGGCHLWEENKHSGCNNLIPVEIALKVASKIKAKERFAVYVVMPMWPEGDPASEAGQDILHWTRETMKMMYRIIVEAIQGSGEKFHPKDFVNFFCLANREKELGAEFVPTDSPHPGSEYWNAQKHRRFMIYVHSKLMIVDDTYLLIGSANVNQRSMDGQRDTEIAIGCYQSSNEQKGLKNSDIRAFRMSLWYEHTGIADKIFLEPQSLECVQSMRSIGEKMWDVYSKDDLQDMGNVHLVSYPVTVTERGVVEDSAKGGHFPDTKAAIKGKRSKVLSSIFTT